MIGCYEFDVGNIYDLENHELYRRWVALTDTTGKKPGVQVQLYIYIYIYISSSLYYNITKNNIYKLNL